MARIKPTAKPGPTPAPTPPAAPKKPGPVLCKRCELAYATKASPDGYCMGCEQRLLRSIDILKAYGYDISR